MLGLYPRMRKYTQPEMQKTLHPHSGHSASGALGEKVCSQPVHFHMPCIRSACAGRSGAHSMSISLGIIPCA